jgi:uncharacterized C2H2 Zn-finger protein
MIRIALPWLVFAYLLVFLAAIFTVWIAYEMVRRFRENRGVRHRLQCAICGMLYEDRTKTPLPHCPRCGSLNERQKLKIY